MDNSSGVGVLDKAAIVLSALEAGPSTLAQLVTATGLARPTAHRLAVALEHHRLVTRDMQGRFVLGPRLGELAAAAGEDRLLAAAGPVLGALRDHTDESAQLFRRQGEHARLRRRGRAACRPARHRSPSAPPCPCGPARPPRSCWPGRSRTACTAACRAPRFTATALSGYVAAAGPRASASASRGRVGVGPRPRPLRSGRRRRVGLRPDRAAVPPARPAATRPPSSPVPRSSPRSLARHAAQQEVAEQRVTWGIRNRDVTRRTRGGNTRAAGSAMKPDAAREEAAAVSHRRPAHRP